jgi:hypothetical protein
MPHHSRNIRDSFQNDPKDITQIEDNIANGDNIDRKDNIDNGLSIITWKISKQNL